MNSAWFKQNNVLKMAMKKLSSNQVEDWNYSYTKVLQECSTSSSSAHHSDDDNNNSSSSLAEYSSPPLQQKKDDFLFCNNNQSTDDCPEVQSREASGLITSPLEEKQPCGSETTFGKKKYNTASSAVRRYTIAYVDKVLDGKESLMSPNTNRMISAVSILLSHMINSTKVVVVGIKDNDFMDQNNSSTMKVSAAEIHQVLSQIHYVGKMNSTSTPVITSLILINRLLLCEESVVLNLNTWRNILFTALMISQKFWDEGSHALSSGQYVEIYSRVFESRGLNISRLNAMESKFLSSIKFSVIVSPSLYAKSYFNLRSLLENPIYCSRERRRNYPLGLASSRDAVRRYSS